MSVYSIKDLEHLSGIKAHTIRIWEQRHQLFSPQRTDTNIRFYSDDDLKLILNISLLKNHGIKISKIVKMSTGEIQDMVIQLTNEAFSHDDEVHALTVAMLDMDERIFKSILDRSQERIGLEQTMTEVIYPFFKKIGILWMANSISPAQEHFMTNLVRQRLIAETDKLKLPTTAPLFVLFLPEDELHEIGLLFANYLLREKGYRTFYLGQSLPLRNLEEIYYTYHPEYLFTVLTSKPSKGNVPQFVQELGDMFKEAKIFVTGQRALEQVVQTPSNVKLINNFEELQSILELAPLSSAAK